MSKQESMSGNELVKLAQEGNRAAFDELAGMCAEKIYNLAFRLTGHTEAAEDLAQDALVNAFKGITKFKQECSFSSWVYRITMNLWKNRVKYENRRFFFRHFSLDSPRETGNGKIMRELPSKDPDPETELEKSMEKDTVQKVLNELDYQARLMIVLRDLEGRSYEEISELAGCRLGTVKSRLARARELLKEKYLEYSGDNKNEL